MRINYIAREVCCFKNIGGFFEFGFSVIKEKRVKIESKYYISSSSYMASWSGQDD